MTRIHGHVAAGFEPVREAFACNFEERGEVGAALCCYHAGDPVVDLWAGVARPSTGEEWRADTLALLFSTTKGITAACIHLLVERGKLRLDAPLADVWPEFGANGKQDITLGELLAHRAGIPIVEGDFTLEQVFEAAPVVEALAAQAPIWEPGSQHGYHVRSFGWILGEIVRRVAGCSLGTFLAREMAGPLNLDLRIGVPASQHERIAETLPPAEPADPAQRELRDQFMGPDTPLGQALTGPSNLLGYGPLWNSAELRQAEIPSSNGHGTAHAVARFYSALVDEVDGIRLLAPETVETMRRAASNGPDSVIHVPTQFGLGVMRPPLLSPEAAAGAFGHSGAGGSLGFADPEARLGFGYVMNRMDMGLAGDPRASALVAAAYSCLR
jgi:CubicO group peptidase (beta-lactamase class C family)